MKPTQIKPQETLDDLVFENRNKAYGAYYLRSTYNESIGKALSFSLFITVTTILLVSHFAFKTNSGTTLVPETDSLMIIDYEIPKTKTPKMETATASKKQPATAVAFFKPAILIPLEPKKTTPLEPIKTNNTNNNMGDTSNEMTAGQTTNIGTGKPETPNGDINTMQGETLTWAEEMPQFMGGYADLKNYINTNFRVPNNLEGTNIKMRLSFIVDENGKVSDITVTKGASPVLDEEAIRVLAKMPPWKPGTMRGKPVKVRFVIPINIKLI